MALLVDQAPFLASNLTQHRVEAGPDKATASDSVKEVASVVLEFMLEPVGGSEIHTQTRLIQIAGAERELKRERFRETAVGSLGRRVFSDLWPRKNRGTDVLLRG